MVGIKQWLERLDIFKWSAALFAFSFSIGIALNSISFSLFCGIGLITTLSDAKKNNLKIQLEWGYIPILLYFLLVLVRECLVNPREAPSVALYYLAFILLPLLFIFQGARIRAYIPFILKSFLFGMILNAIVNLGFGIYRGIIIREEGISFWYFTYHHLAEPFSIQPIYLGYFYVLAIFILIYFKKSFKISVVYYLFVSLLVISVFLLAARNAILCMITLAPILLLITKKTPIKSAIILFGIFVVCLFGALQNPVVKNRVMKVNNKANVYSGSSLRLSIWQSALSASKANMIWGSGEKKSHLLLMNQFEQRGLDVPLKQKYHSHNQYLNTLMQYGAVGTLLIILFFIISIWGTWTERNYLGLVFMVLFLLTMVTEAIFARQWGVFSFAFFGSLFAISSRVSVPLSVQ